VFATSTLTAPGSPRQYQVSTGFEVPVEQNAPWTGIIERRRFSCDSTTQQPVEETVIASDRLQDRIRVQTNPSLLTTLPETGSPNGYLYGRTSGSPCGVPNAGDPTGCNLVPLNDSTLDTNTFGLGPAGSVTNARRQEILDWMYGATGSPRASKKLGDIYHSSPVIQSRPRFDTGDEAFNQFRISDVVANRPVTLFVNTNDGMIRAISLEDFTAPPGSTIYNTNYTAGDQFWGFVPPLLLDKLEDNLTDHRLTMDGIPVVKDVYFNRVRGARATSNAQQYHSVLVTGMRGGLVGQPTNAYIALDVTNPTSPKFLWQFTDPHMGKTYAQPAIVQAIYRFDTGGGTFITKNGAIAILPGGVGITGASSVPNDCANGATNPAMLTSAGRPFQTKESPTSSAVANHRTDIRCWRDYGRSLYFVDVETGQLIKKIHTTGSGGLVFPSPLVSTPAVFQSDVGTLASRAYVTDADGVIWRIDLSDPDPQPNDPMNGWTARPFHDIFWDRSPTQGEVSYEAPILSTDEQGQLVVIAGTGDSDNFVKPTVENRVVSLTEVRDNITVGLPAVERNKAALNWEKRVKPTGGLVASELVTGSMALFSGQLYFGTFIAIAGNNACDMGKGRVFAVDYLQKDTTDLNTGGSSQINTWGPLPIVTPGLNTASNSIINVGPTSAADNLMVLGLGVTERPSCANLDTASFDAFGQSVPAISQTENPALYLVAQGSGDTSSLLTEHSNSRLRSVELQIKRPRTASRVLSWAGSVD